MDEGKEDMSENQKQNGTPEPLSTREHVGVARDMAAFVAAAWAGDQERASSMLAALDVRELPSAFGSLASIAGAALRTPADTSPAVFLATVGHLLDDGADQ